VLLVVSLIATACTPVAAQQSDGAADSTESSEEACTPLPAPYLVSPEIAAPQWPFYGVVTVFTEDSDDETRSRVVVRFHNALTRSTTDIVVASATFPYWANVSATVSGIYFDPIFDNYFYRSRPGCDGYQLADTRVRIVIPWGQPAQLLPVGVESEVAHGSPLPRNTERFVTGGATFQIASQHRQVHLRAGESTNSYELSPIEDRQSDDTPGYLRLHAYWDYLRGTDGEHLVLASWPEEPAAAPEQIYVLSLRTGEIVACGILAPLRMLFVAPPNEGLLVAEPQLPPPGEIDLSDACERDLDEEFFTYLADLPEVVPYAPVVPRPLDLPDQRAPASSFQGIVHSYTSLSRGVFQSDRHVQFYDLNTRELNEVVFNDLDLEGLLRRLETGNSGISVARHEPTGSRLVLPWDGLPVLVAPGDRRFAPMRTDTLAAPPGHGADAARQAICEPMRVAVGSEHLVVTGAQARYEGGSRYGNAWVRIEYADQESNFVFREAPEGIGADVNVTVACQSHQINPFRSSGDVLVLTVTGGWDDWGRATHELFYLFSLRTGELLTCGIDDLHNDLAVTFAPHGRLETRPLVLPPSGWLDPAPCSTARDQSDESCLRVFLRQGYLCARSLDLASIDEPPPPGWFTPANIQVVENDS